MNYQEKRQNNEYFHILVSSTGTIKAPNFMDAGFYTHASATSVIAGSLICIFTLQSSVEVKGNVGLVSLGAYYGVAVVSSCMVYPFLIRLIGRKYNLLLGDASSIIFGVALIYPMPIITIVTRALLGFLEPSFWSASFAIAASYQISTSYFATDEDKTKKVLRLIVIIGIGQGLMSLLPNVILKESYELDKIGVVNVSYDIKCGAQDCPTEYSDTPHNPIYRNLIPSPTSLHIFVGILAGIQMGA